jgi:HAE1 family hydrophobic/amphiphilic exporter-1
VTLSDLSIQRPVLTWMMVLALIVFGVLGYNRLGVDHFPSMEFPMVTVTATLEGASPEGMEEDVTDVLEEHLNTIQGIRSLRSTTTQGSASIVVEFALGTDLEAAAQDVRAEVAKARRRLPRELEPPLVSKMNTGDHPVMWVPFQTTRTQTEASEYIRRHVKPMLETVPGVGGIQMFGRSDRSIRIWVDGEALRARGLTAGDVLAALRREHVEVPGGLVESENVEWSVKTDAEFGSVAELQRLIIAHRGTAPIYLRDVARVEDGESDLRGMARFNGQPTVGVGVMKQSGANTVAVVDEADRRLGMIRPLLPEGITLDPEIGYIDMSTAIRESVAETQFSLMFGGLLAVLVVFVFLRRTRPTLIVAAAIPLSLIGTFGLVWLSGATLNTMTLLGMTLAIGVVIDDAIIVLENIERHRALGKSPREAASVGTREITFAAAAATISVAAVFLPVVFVEGILGNFLGEFGLTVAGAVMISLLVALTLTPMLAARMAPPKEREHGSLFHRLEVGFEWVESHYRQILNWAIDHRGRTMLLAGASMLLAVFFGWRLGGEFFPPSDQGMLMGFIETPPGTTLNATLEYLKRDEDFLLAQPEVRGLFSALGYSGGQRAAGANHGMLFVNLTPPSTRDRSSLDLVRITREQRGQVPGRNLSIFDPSAMMGGGMSRRQFEVLLRGNLALQELDALGDIMIEKLEQRGGFVNLEKSLKLGQPEVRVFPDRERAAALGVDASTIAQTIQMMIGGLDVGIFKEGGQRFDIRMRLEHADRDNPAEIKDLFVRGRDGQVVELRNLVSIETGAAPSSISRVNRQRSIAISGNLQDKPLGSAMKDAYAVADEVLPEGVTISPSGQAEAMKESVAQFGVAIGLGLLVIYMVLAAQFESFVHPLTVMLAVPLAMVGALGGLWICQMTLNVFSGIGIILLFGLVTKNSILLVDYANQLRGEGMDKVEAMRTAAPVRMRPVLMTALSMIFGVLPAALGLGPGAETRAPMAVATAAGMFSSMLLTLVVVPVFYIVIDNAVETARDRLLSLIGRGVVAADAR